MTGELTLEAAERVGATAWGGGVPLTGEDGRVVGGVGVSAGSQEQDHDVAAAGAAAL
jgi:uncharacterized protein GlcG (DUF336 family)